MEVKSWERTAGGRTFLISTSKEFLDHGFIQNAFDHPDMYWAKRTSSANMKAIVENSCVLGLYEVSAASSPHQSRTPIGIARMITDYTTFAYLTDVYVVEEFRKLGLGKWLIDCCREIVQEIPDLRWMILLTTSEVAKQMYKKSLGMIEMSPDKSGGLVAMGARKASLESVDK